MLRGQTFMSLTSNDKFRFLLGRRSIRVYAPGEVSDETVTRLLEAAMAAPSAMTKDPWRFVVVRNPQTLGQLAAALPGGKMLPAATLALVVCGDLDAVFDGQLSYLLQDCSACIENLLLAAHALDLGACWVGVHPSEEAMRRLRDLLALPTRMVPIAVVSLGLPGETLEARTRYQKEYVRLEQWGK
jgi:nitroreductase